MMPLGVARGAHSAGRGARRLGTPALQRRRSCRSRCFNEAEARGASDTGSTTRGLFQSDRSFNEAEARRLGYPTLQALAR
jgi:hypothetical protein